MVITFDYIRTKTGRTSRGAITFLCHRAPSKTKPLHFPPEIGSSPPAHAFHRPDGKYTSRAIAPLCRTGATTISSPSANWSRIANVELSCGSSHHSGRQMGSSDICAARARRKITDIASLRIESAARTCSDAPLLRSHGAIENCTAGIRQQH